MRMQALPTLRRRNRGLTLVEVVITTVIVAITGISIIASLAYGIHVQQALRERNGAIRVANDALEASKRTLFNNLREEVIQNVVIDDRGTQRADDDVVGTVTLRFFDQYGTRVGTNDSPIPLDRSMLTAEATVVWRPAGRRASELQTITLTTLISP